MGGGGLTLVAIAILLIGGLVVLPLWLRAAASAAPRDLSQPPSFGPLAFEPRSSKSAPGMGPARMVASAEAMGRPEDMTDALIDVRRVEKRINQASIKRMNEIIERHPEAVGQALRRWLSDGQR
jgi:hypothetical protein